MWMTWKTLNEPWPLRSIFLEWKTKPENPARSFRKVRILLTTAQNVIRGLLLEEGEDSFRTPECHSTTTRRTSEDGYLNHTFPKYWILFSHGSAYDSKGVKMLFNHDPAYSPWADGGSRRNCRPVSIPISHDDPCTWDTNDWIVYGHLKTVSVSCHQLEKLPENYTDAKVTQVVCNSEIDCRPTSVDFVQP
jgi:hypothetical protein